jgi:hypothetical protein
MEAYLKKQAEMKNKVGGAGTGMNKIDQARN